METLEQNPELEEDSQKGKFLTFKVGPEEYGIEIVYVNEIIGGIPAITEVPEVPVYIKGIINLRGKIIPLIDINLRFKKNCREYSDRSCIIVINFDHLLVGLVVDSVAEVIYIAEDSIIPPPETRTGFKQNYISGIARVESNIKLLLDCKSLLNYEEMANVV